jgi:hypothetical protein
VGKNNVLYSFLLQLCNYKLFLTMNNQILPLENQAAALHSAISELLNDDKLTAIDKDHLKHQCLLLYELILELSPAEDVAPEIPVVQEIIPIVRETAPIVPETLFVPEADEPLKVAMQQKPLFEEELTLNDLAKASETAPIKLPETETEIQNRTIDEILDLQQKITEATPTVVDVELSLHEKIAHSLPPKENLIEKLASSIPSLKNAINVNLKIALVNQLFNDNTVEYVKAIDKLNSCENIHEAMRYFNELKHQYTWDGENHNVKELEQLLNKRYGS